MKTFGLLALILLSGCGKTDPYFNSFIAKFEQDGGIIITALRINFGDANGKDLAAECIIDFSGPHIIVEKQLWDKMDKTTQEVLLYHEMGHCVLGRDHSSEWIDGRPKSVMIPGIVGASPFYADNRAEYLRELFYRY